LVSIYEVIARENPDRADQFIKDIIQQINHLAEIGYTGSPRDWVSPGLKMYPFQKRCIYFEVTEDQFIVLRILHEAQDVDSQF